MAAETAGPAGSGPTKRGTWAVTDVLTTARGMEYSVHRCPRQYVGDLAAMFKGVVDDASRVLIVPTCQRATLDLVNTGADVDREKDRLLETFMEWAAAVSERLAMDGAFVDYIDPCSGLPMRHKDNNNCYYGEVDALQTLMGYSVANAGCCKIVLHPKWGSSVYPATLFTDAPLESFLKAAEEVDRLLGSN